MRVNDLKSVQKFGFINGVDNVNWPPYRDSKSDFREEGKERKKISKLFCFFKTSLTVFRYTGLPAGK